MWTFGNSLPRKVTFFLGLVPFLVLIGLYSYFSYKRHLENPRDKFLPNAKQLLNAVKKSTRSNPRTGNIDLLVDIKASLKRIALAMLISILSAIWFGLTMGAFPGIEAIMLNFVNLISFVPPLVLLPLVFIFVGIGESAKILIIFLGTFFILTRDIYLKIKNTPIKLVHKGYTLGASTLEVVFKIMLPYSWPGILQSTRLAITQGWIYLIAAEMISASEGLGYRINVVQRQLAVNTILWYIFVIALIAFLVDRSILLWINYFHPYHDKG
ncbi:ABC transporter permease [Candidatus Riflebacteria bacterium]